MLTELVAYEQPGSKNVQELKELLRDDNEWEELSHLMEAEITALGQDPNTPTDDLVAEILELATIAREHQGDRDRAAELLHQALGIAPTHEEALARYVDHFRERRDWRGLIDLYEFALDNARDAGAEPDDLVRRLEEIAQLAELRLGDIPRAIEAWQRIAELEPGSPKVAEALRRLTSRGKMWEQLVVEPRDRGRVRRRSDHAHAVAQEDGADVSRAPARAAPRDRALRAGARRESRRRRDAEGARASCTRKRATTPGSRTRCAASSISSSTRLQARCAKPGAPADAPKEWPVAKRSERLNVLRRLAQHLRDAARRRRRRRLRVRRGARAA